MRALGAGARGLRVMLGQGRAHVEPLDVVQEVKDVGRTPGPGLRAWLL